MRLDLGSRDTYSIRSQSAGWPLPFGAEESPGSTETRRRIRSGGGDPRESATESKPPRVTRAERPPVRAARVKGCGKSAPPGRRRPGHGKPRREQDRIGATRKPKGLQAHLRAVARVGRQRRPATAVPEEWSSRGAGETRFRHTEPGLQAGWRPFFGATDNGFAKRLGACARLLAIRYFRRAFPCKRSLNTNEA